MSIHIFDETGTGGDWSVWSDPEEGEKLGRCIGTGPTKEAAVRDGITELKSDIAELKRELP